MTITHDYYKAAVAISFTPEAFKRSILRFTKMPNVIAKAEAILTPYFEKRWGLINSGLDDSEMVIYYLMVLLKILII
ncbi:hypothetical protein D9758_018850 [Tetrapyrgos nigripes]|uniref:Uncharacterized protein n=1 Tax=Tetrapyrgos nigripes TaxID=182062 RepID=A0A8H5F0W5_9AGAR|nr:hypothetical protein D9758_018850 [Tetrapyrgos nigripes]